MRVFITEFDKDYHTVTDTVKMEFNNLEEAELWCDENSWTGYSYWVDKKLTEAVNK